jgi:hypothetical protein
MKLIYESIAAIAIGDTYSEKTLVSALSYTDKPSQLMAIVRYLKGCATASDSTELQQLSVDIFQAYKNIGE